MVTVEAIPYSNFKEKVRITKELIKCRPLVIEVYPNFIYVEGENTNDRGVQGAFKQHRTA